MTTSEDGTDKKPRGELASQLDALVADLDTPEATAFLVGLSGRHAGKLFRVKEGESILGRSSSALVTFDEKAVSQKHAQLVLRAGQCVLVDLGSTNGTYVNDVRLTQPVELHAGDVIRLGKSALGFLTDAEDQEQHTRALARIPISNLVPSGSGGYAAAQRSAIVAAGSGAVPAAAVNPLDNILDKLALGVGFLKTYWRGVVLGSALGALLGASTIFTRPPMATAEFIIALTHQQADEQQGGQRFVANSASYFRHPQANFVNIALVSSTLKLLDMPAAAAAPFTAQLKFDMLEEGVYRGEFVNADAVQAERFLAAHLQNYLEEEITKSIKVLGSEVALLRKQYQDNERVLRETEAKLKTFKETHLQGLPENAVGQLASRAELQTRAVELQASVDRYAKELALSQKLHAQEDAIVATRVDRSQSHSTALATIRQKLATLRSRGLTDAHPEVDALLKEERSVAALEQKAVSAETTEIERRANREYSTQQSRIGELDVLLSSSKTELGLVSGRLAEIDKISSMMPAVEAEFAELSRTLSTSQNLHTHLYEQLKAKELKLEFDRASVAGRYELLEPLTVQGVAPAQTALKRAGAGAGAGLALGVVGGLFHLLVLYARRRSRGTEQTALLGPADSAR